MQKSQTMTTEVNGFCEKDTFIFFKYVCWFEKIRPLKTDKFLFNQCPQQKHFWNHFTSKQFDFQSEKAAKMPSKDTRQKSNTVVFTISAKTRQLSFLRHLRNAIAHGTIKTNGKSIEFTDYNAREKRYSCIGNLSNVSLKSFFDSFLSTNQ